MSAFDVRDIMKAAGPGSGYKAHDLPFQEWTTSVARPGPLSPLVLCGLVRMLERCNNWPNYNSS